MRRALILALALSLALAPAAVAGDEPTMDELARMVLHGTDAEQAMVARWVETAERATLLDLFRAVRALRAAEPEELGVVDVALRVAEEARRLVHIETKLIEMPAEVAHRLLGPQRPQPGRTHRPTHPPTHRQMDAAAAKRLLANIQATPAAQVVSSPRVTTYDGQRANVSILNQVSYVQDYDVEHGKDERGEDGVIIDPIIGVIQEGVTIDLKAHLEDAGSVRLEFVGTWSAVRQPIAEREIEIAGHEVKVQLPEIFVAKTEATAALADGGYVLIGGGASFDTGDRRVERVALVHVRILDPSTPAGSPSLVPPDFGLPVLPPPKREGK
jgi:hypothetical protein